MMLRQFIRDDAGTTMIEYGLIFAIIIAACVAAMSHIGATPETLLHKFLGYV